ncbi:MAG: DHH family phosphoesterase [Candidatus Micrarchaeia archaeon]
MTGLNFNDLQEFIKANSQRKFLLTFHSIGDRDGVGSAISLSMYLKNSIVGTPDFITNNARRMLDQVGYQNKINPASTKGIDIVIVLDANNLEALGNFKEEVQSFKGKVVFVDHHLLPPVQNKKHLMFSDESYNSTASIIYDLLKSLGAGVNKKAAILLLNGIISDSADFRNATAYTFKQVSELLDIANMSYSDILEYFHESIPLNSRYSLINDLYSSKVEIVGKYLLIYGKASMHANVAADIAMKLGADASLFWSESEKEVSISSRLRPPLDKKLPMHLGRVMQGVSKILGGNGGGHPCAAGAYGPKKEMIGKAVEEALISIKKQLSA